MHRWSGRFGQVEWCGSPMAATWSPKCRPSRSPPGPAIDAPPVSRRGWRIGGAAPTGTSALPTRPGRSSPCSIIPPWPTGAGCSSSTTTSFSSTPWSGPASAPLCSRWVRPAKGWLCPSTGMGGCARSTQGAAPPGWCSRLRSTWPSSGRARWRWSTISTSETPSTPRSCGSSSRRSRGSPRRARRWVSRWSAATSPSTTRPMGRT